ncbi:ABC transporter ATP-binding protein [Asanoa ishikariensis]|uniref:Carbohydrate ABC transporter substrate-binding protein, CUT1 family n=1 Tax=Asanoa ishikariensis TaxID=137265 RepID=A0A1H3R0A5_9ACTN|nr:extracellular solute-binding protein [Asanoa ishikariensis]GIF64539.1 ABC transporter ATP-binding protein [Asanoa ishikariensis]SDZ19026.1 carbohydrate ABC transporter substrate-binding protein, CUT1 family [Asanoa ishikariensis]
MRRFPRRPAVALLATFCLLAGGCSAGDREGSGDSVTLSVFWWGDQDRAERTEAALKLYSNRHPGTTFKVTWQGEAGYYDRLATQAVGGNAPDLFQIDDSRLVDYATQGLLLDLSAPVARGQVDVTRFPPGLADYGTVGGKVVAVAAGAETSALIYNRSLVKELGVAEPKTGMSYSQLLAWAARVTRESGGEVNGLADASGDLDAFWMWLRAQGRELYQGDGPGFGTEDVVRWFTLWQEARWDDATPSAGGANARRALVDGKVAAAFGSSGQFAGWQAGTDDQLALVACPGDTRGQWARANYYWAGFRGTRDAGAVADVIDFLANDPQAGRALGDDRGFAPNLEVREANGADLAEGPVRTALAFESAMSARIGRAPAPPPLAHAELRTLLAASAAAVASEKSTLNKAADDFARKSATALAR